MATIVTRAGKGSPLTHVEVDANFTNLNTAKAELASPALTGNVTVASNSATSAVTITQIGAGNALVVEDSASPDATPFVVTATGSVGIGTSSPAAPLTVSALGNSLDLVTPSGGLRFYVSTTNFATLLGNSTNHPLQIFTNNTERMRIDASGNVTAGAGSTAITYSIGGIVNLPAATTESRGIELGTGRTGDGLAYIDFVGDATYTDFGLRIIRSGTANSDSFVNHRGTGSLILRATDAGALTFQTTSLERMRIDASGNVGIGTSSPTTKLDVSGTVNATALSIGGTALTATAAELNYVDGVTSAIQTQLDAKAPTGPAGAAALMGYTSTVTNAGATNLTNTSTQYQLFTGTLVQTIRLPTTSTLTTGWTFHIVNNSTENLTVNATGSSFVCTVLPGMTAMLTCISTAVSDNTAWEFGFTDFGSVTGTGSAVLSNAPSLTGNLSFNSGYGSSAVAYGCRAWVKFGSTGTISGSGNVSSVTVNATGSFTVNFTTAMPDANYSAVGTAGNSDVAGDEIVSFFPPTRVATGSLGVRNSSGGGTAVSAAVNFVSVFR